MQLNVLYFAHVREKVGKASEQLTCPDSATVADVLHLLETEYPQLLGLMPVIRVAVNGEFAEEGDIVPANAELVLVPPVSGGVDLPKVALTYEVIDVDRIRAMEKSVSSNACGALVTFNGVVRAQSRGRTVTHLTYEAYESMAYRKMDAIVTELEGRHPDISIGLHHRLGLLEVGETAVVVVVASPHRREAFEVCSMVIDRLKQEVPIWKHEAGPDGEQWVTDRP